MPLFSPVSSADCCCSRHSLPGALHHHLQQPVTPAVSTLASPRNTGTRPTEQHLWQSARQQHRSVAVATTSTPAPVYTYSEGNVVAYTAASLKGVSPKLAEGFAKMYPGHTVVFNLDGTQALKTQVQNGAYADVFISASNSYTTRTHQGGYFVDGTVKPLTSNYVIVILPANNPGKYPVPCRSCKARPEDCTAAKTVPVGTATDAALANLAKSTYGRTGTTPFTPTP